MSPPPLIGLCTDSSSQIPALLAARFGVEVVPVTLTVDGVDRLDSEGELPGGWPTAAPGRTSTVGRAAEVLLAPPSPGQFAAAYENLLDRGCTGILSLHGAGTGGATVTAARLAARAVPVPVRAVDTRLDDFGVSCALWAAALALEHGASLDEAGAHAESAALHVGNVFVSGLSGERRGALPVLTLRGGNVELLERLETAAEAVNAMAAFALGWGDRLRVGIGHSAEETEVVADALDDAVSAAANVIETVRFRMGASASHHVGRDSVSCWLLPS